LASAGGGLNFLLPCAAADGGFAVQNCQQTAMKKLRRVVEEFA
jgi:hypothetical protein